MKRSFALTLLGIILLLAFSSTMVSAYYYGPYGAQTRYYGPIVYPASTHDNTYAYGRAGWNYYSINNYGGYLYPYATPYGGWGYGYPHYGLPYGGYGYWPGWTWGPWSYWGRFSYWPGYWGGFTVAYFYY